ncbi:sorting nexin-21 [Agrilus planipennis]|uniref:Sorting nexin-21 n=1 Tax=Agrilus planipennis TaxID=224129 RepID=A0A1W4XMK9_AGRPL|nr:sorting nexin-21 [Agrilus planipennis]
MSVSEALDIATALPSKNQPLLFEIVSAFISEKDSESKKHVVYTLQVRHISGRDDFSPATIDRRYTDFLNLYLALKQEYPNLMQTVHFPKKVLIGNFDNKLITNRSTGFETLLKHISTNASLRSSPALLSFLQDQELLEAKQLIDEKQFSTALPILENSFQLLNKIYTDRSPAVILALCRVLGCSVAIPGSPNAKKWADLALHRYEGVSDSDLLELYLPLLHVCIKVWWQMGLNKDRFETRLLDLRRQGLKANESLNLLDAIKEVEEKLQKLSVPS